MFSSDHELSLVHGFGECDLQCNVGGESVFCLLSSGKYSMSEEEELLVQFEQFEQELKVKNILKEVKSELSFVKDLGVDEFPNS